MTQLAHKVDLNTLDALSRTCRQIRVNLLQYRNRLVQQTLRCENEFRDANSAESEKPGQKWHILGEAGHLVSGKVSMCARDLVSDCRRCGRIVCRVRLLLPSTTSPPSDTVISCAIYKADQSYPDVELHIQTPAPLIPPLPLPPPLPHLHLRPPLLFDFLIPLHLHKQHPPLCPVRRLSRNRGYDVSPRVDVAHAVRDELWGLRDGDRRGE